MAILKLARDAVDRIFNFFNKNSLVLGEEENFFISSNITKAIILGKSKRYKNIFSIPNLYLGYSLDNGITTTQLYEDTPVLKITTQQSNFCFSPVNSRNISDFRLVLGWEEEELASPIRWGDDEHIMLYGNRRLRKLKDRSNPENLIDLTILQLSAEKLEEKKQNSLLKSPIKMESWKKF